MSDTKWIKGKWVAQLTPDPGMGYKVRCPEKHNMEVARVPSSTIFTDGEAFGTTHAERKATIRLIAAAPELYAIAERMALALERLDSGHPHLAEWNAVSAKARGEKQ